MHIGVDSEGRARPGASAGTVELSWPSDLCPWGSPLLTQKCRWGCWEGTEVIPRHWAPRMAASRVWDLLGPPPWEVGRPWVSSPPVPGGLSVSPLYRPAFPAELFCYAGALPGLRWPEQHTHELYMSTCPWRDVCWSPEEGLWGLGRPRGGRVRTSDTSQQLPFSGPRDPV